MSNEKKLLDEAERIASDIAGGPVGIRFLPPKPKAQTGLPLDESIVAEELCHLLRQLPPQAAVGLHMNASLPSRWTAALKALVARGHVVEEPPSRGGWTYYSVPDPAFRQTMEVWGADHQEREVQEWEYRFEHIQRDRSLYRLRKK